jgi:RHS repeat-associated protein
VRLKFEGSASGNFGRVVKTTVGALGHIVAKGSRLALLSLGVAASLSVHAATTSTQSKPLDPGASALPIPPGDSVAPKTYYEQGILARSGETVDALGPNLMGDKVNEYSGDLSFTQVDVSLPGNNSLPVQVARHRSASTEQAPGAAGLFGDWDIEIPRLYTIAAAPQPNWYGAGSAANLNRCSQFREPPYTGVMTFYGMMNYFARTYWDGYHLHVPGKGDQTMLQRSGANPIAPSAGAAAYPLVTKEHWQLSCLPTLDTGSDGEGFLALAPDGATYRFDHMVVRAWPLVRVTWSTGRVSGGGEIKRVQVVMLPTLVTDRFGNWVRYNYAGPGSQRITSIESSDNRRITFTYSGSGDRIQSVSDGTRTWTYGYFGQGYLQTVTQPDNSQWQFSLYGLGSVLSSPDPACDGWDNILDGSQRNWTMTHPSGTVGSFNVVTTAHGRSNVTGGNACGFNTNPTSRYFASRSLTSKTLSGPGMPAMTWSYAYSPAVGSFAPCNGCVNTKTVTITDPLGNMTVNTYGTQFKVNDGLLLQSAEGVVNGTATRTTTYEYRDSSAGPYPDVLGTVIAPADTMSRKFTPLNKRTTIQAGVVFTHDASCATCIDAYAREVAWVGSSSLGYSRAESTTLFDQTALWVLGQPASHTINGVTASSTSYNPATALPTASYKFGKLQATYGFNADGTLATLTDGLNHTTTYSNYHRGLARNIGYADGTAISAAVNNTGTIASVTNEVGSTWAYGYDAIGRIASATPPAGDPVAYNTKFFNFAQIGAAEYGIEPGHWKQTITEGNAVTVNVFDARWRKRITTTYDAADPGNTQRTQRFDYDPYNRTTFAAYPVRTLGAITDAVAGTTTSYDALGRPIRSVADSELGPLTTVTDYLSGFQKRVTDPRGFATTMGYQAFDEPSEAAITSITAPENVSVSINRDVFGKPLAITRGGPWYGSGPASVTRSYVYDANQLLCKTLEPETGATVQVLDAANNLAWRGTGLNLPNPVSCDAASVPAANITAFSYDARNRLTGTGFGDGSPSIGRSYTADGLPLTVVSGATTRVNAYNNRRLLVSEQINPSSWGWQVIYGFDANAHLSQMNNLGLILSYAPNALGEASRVGNYATSVSYHPNGAVAAYTLGNGLAHSLTQNLRGLPSVNRDTGVVQDQYSYDPNGNITAITDQLGGVASRSMGYDGLDRLTAANSPGVWGSASYAYDALDNLRVSNVGGRSSTHNYDARNRLESINTNGAYTGYAYDPQGNVTGRGTQGFYFDQGNRLQLAPGIATYTYDGLGMRSIAAGANGNTSLYFYSQAGQLLYHERQPGWQASTRYIHLGSKLIAEEGMQGVRYLHTDALGSPVARSDASATVLTRTRYEPYGGTAAGSTAPNVVGFTGHVNDPDSGLVYMQQRYYDPVASRFLSIDPVTTDANTGAMFDRYMYANNNPYRYTDPDGREPLKQGFTGNWTTVYQAGGSGSGISQSARATAVTAGAALGGSAGVVAAAGCAGVTAGLCGLGSPAIIGAGIAGGALVGNAAASLVDWTASVISSAGNTNPYTGPVSDPVVVVDQKGNAIPVGGGQQVKTSPTGDYQQVLGADGRPTGDRLDRGGHKGQKDPAAQGPHGHRPGVTTPDGNPHLPIY